MFKQPDVIATNCKGLPTTISDCQQRHLCTNNRSDCHQQLGCLDLLDLRAILGFERWQSANNGLPLGSVIDHLGGIDGVEASRMEIMFD